MFQIQVNATEQQENTIGIADRAEGAACARQNGGYLFAVVRFVDRVIGHHQSLLITRGDKIEGILRLTDVFAAVFHKMKECFEE